MPVVAGGEANSSNPFSVAEGGSQDPKSKPRIEKDAGAVFDFDAAEGIGTTNSVATAERDAPSAASDDSSVEIVGTGRVEEVVPYVPLSNSLLSAAEAVKVVPWECPETTEEKNARYVSDNSAERAAAGRSKSKASTAQNEQRQTRCGSEKETKKDAKVKKQPARRLNKNKAVAPESGQGRSVLPAKRPRSPTENDSTGNVLTPSTVPSFPTPSRPGVPWLDVSSAPVKRQKTFGRRDAAMRQVFQKLSRGGGEENWM
jgi:hypothetical protein